MTDTTSVDGERLLDEPSHFVEHYIGVEPFDYQEEFMDHESNRKAFVSGRRVGKSRTAAWLALHAATTNYNYQVLITAPSQRQSTELFNQVKSEIRHSDIPEDGWGIERSTRTEINFTSGSRIKVVPLGNDGSNVRGFGADMLIVDEAAFVDGDIFREVLSPMLAFGDGEFILLSTPLGKKGYLWQQWEKILGRKQNDEGWYGKQVPTHANPGIKESFIEKQRNDLSKNQFKREYLGEFDESSDSFFDPEDLTDDDVALESAVNQQQKICYLGVDLASTGGDRSVYVSVDADGNVFDVEYTEDAPLTDAMARVRELHSFNDYTTILLDATGLGEGVVAQLQEDLGKRTVEGFKFTNEKKQSLYNTLKNQLQNKEIRYQHIPNADEPENLMVSELMDLGYSYTQTGKIRIEHPSGGRDDFCDSLALAVWAKSQKKIARSDAGSMKPFSLGKLRGN
jgi:hypothetical protein